MPTPKVEYRDSIFISLANKKASEWKALSRYCLKCEKKFKPLGRFNRICKMCTRTNVKVLTHNGVAF